MKTSYILIGYYNNPEDCKALFPYGPEHIIDYMENDMGDFRTVWGDEETSIDEDITAEPDFEQIKKTSDGLWLVRYEKGSEGFLSKAGGCDWYIDIYRLIETPDAETKDSEADHPDEESSWKLIPEDRLKNYINRDWKGNFFCEKCNQEANDVKGIPYAYDPEENRIIFAYSCPHCGEIFYSR